MAMTNTPYFDLPPGPELAWRNRRILAKRVGWPDGALEACEEIEQAHPGWSLWWQAANEIKGFESPAGFYATRHTSRGRHTAYGADRAIVAAAIEAVVSDCPECGTRLPVPVGSDIPWHSAEDGKQCVVHWGMVTVQARSACPVCRTKVDVPPGSDVPPHEFRDAGDWCRARCSQRTV